LKIFFFVLIPVFFFSFSCSSGSKKENDTDNINDADLTDDTINEEDLTQDTDTAVETDVIDEDAEYDVDVITDEDILSADEDVAPDEDIVTVPPVGCIQGDYKVYFGNFHAHTSNSDGVETPDFAFKYGRDEGELDIFAITDHLEQLYTLYGMADSDLPDCIETAKSLTDENYLALCGYEYGSGFKVSLETGLNISTGHSNVFFHDKLFPIAQLDFRDYYKSLETCFDCIAQFNHPGDEETQTFNEFEPYQPIFNKMALYEFNGAGDVWNLFFLALSKGWYLSPTFNQDNHSANWGTADDNRTGLYMSTFSMDGLMESFVQRRTFATEDKNASIKMLAGGICWMGSQLSGVKNIKISVEVADRDNEGFEKIELFDGLQNIISEVNCDSKPECVLLFDLSVEFPMHIVARATQTDGQKIVSAPLWFIP